MTDLTTVEQVEKLLLGTCLRTVTPRGKRRHRKHGSKWTTALRHDPCAYCGRQGAKSSRKERKEGIFNPESITIDHIDPRPAPRNNENQAAACGACNKDKADTPLLFFLLENEKSRPTKEAAE